MILSGLTYSKYPAKIFSSIMSAILETAQRIVFTPAGVEHVHPSAKISLGSGDGIVFSLTDLAASHSARSGSSSKQIVNTPGTLEHVDEIHQHDTMGFDTDERNPDDPFYGANWWDDGMKEETNLGVLGGSNDVFVPHKYEQDIRGFDDLPHLTRSLREDGVLSE
jgi:hypothetical protein